MPDSLVQYFDLVLLHLGVLILPLDDLEALDQLKLEACLLMSFLLLKAHLVHGINDWKV